MPIVIYFVVVLHKHLLLSSLPSSCMHSCSSGLFCTMRVLHARIVPAVIYCTDQIKVFPFPDGNEQMCSNFSHRLFKFLAVDLLVL